MWSLIDGKHIVSVLHHDRLFVDRVDDCLDDEIDGRTEDLFHAMEDNPVKICHLSSPLWKWGLLIGGG